MGRIGKRGRYDQGPFLQRPQKHSAVSLFTLDIQLYTPLGMCSLPASSFQVTVTAPTETSPTGAHLTVIGGAALAGCRVLVGCHLRTIKTQDAGSKFCVRVAVTSVVPYFLGFVRLPPPPFLHSLLFCPFASKFRHWLLF